MLSEICATNFHVLDSHLLHLVALLAGFEVNSLYLSLFFFCLVTPDQAADDHVKIKITKYKTGHSPDGEVKVQELGEGDPQWKHIKDVVKEQLEKAGLKPEGTKKGESLKGSLPFCVSHLWIFLSSSTTTLWLSESGFPNLLTDKMIMLWQKDIRQVKGGRKKKFLAMCVLCVLILSSFLFINHHTSSSFVRTFLFELHSCNF